MLGTQEAVLECKQHDLGKIYSDARDAPWVRLYSSHREVEAYKVQIYGDGFGNFNYGVDHHGEALYYFNGDWIPYGEIEDALFPDFVEIDG